MINKFKFASILLSFCLISGLVSCGGSDDDQGSIRVLHGSPDAPAVDLLIDDQIAADGLTYTNATGYIDIDEGQRDIKVNLNGTSDTVINAGLDIEKDQDYTLIATNRAASLETIFLQDNDDTESGISKVRVVHGAPSAPAVDVYVTSPNADLNASQPVLSGVPFKAASDYLSVPAGDYQVRVTVAGTKTVAIDTGTLSLAPEENYTAVALDAQGGGAPFQVKLLNDTE
jgi:Domain of unknown function (DUF4397)